MTALKNILLRAIQDGMLRMGFGMIRQMLEISFVAWQRNRIYPFKTTCSPGTRSTGHAEIARARTQNNGRYTARSFTFNPSDLALSNEISHME